MINVKEIKQFQFVIEFQERFLHSKYRAFMEYRCTIHMSHRNCEKKTSSKSQKICHLSESTQNVERHRRIKRISKLARRESYVSVA